MGVQWCGGIRTRKDVCQVLDKRARAWAEAGQGRGEVRGTGKRRAREGGEAGTGREGDYTRERTSDPGHRVPCRCRLASGGGWGTTGHMGGVITPPLGYWITPPLCRVVRPYSDVGGGDQYPPLPPAPEGGSRAQGEQSGSAGVRESGRSRNSRREDESIPLPRFFTGGSLRIPRGGVHAKLRCVTPPRSLRLSISTRGGVTKDWIPPIRGPATPVGGQVARPPFTASRV